MAQFADADEVYRYVGGVFRAAGEHPDAGPPLRAAGITLQMHYADPPSQITVRFDEPYEVIEGDTDVEADVHLMMPADIAHQYWLGEYNLAVGLAKKEVRAKGPVTKILRLVPLTKPLFPLYRDLVDEKDAAPTA
ncbi:hypothetical protein [Conexibacter sp. SYSU D00693]|uniref:hypothetical protein n=1 Tax=Conexibacter sp. SYSU D00693 TaxID=2812560 RepID=UPI00196AC8D5|nr:hypothetical protein [Conexibacter sp. SYSU D00693]